MQKEILREILILSELRHTNLIGDTTNQPAKFRTRNWVAINDESPGKYDNSNVEFKTSMIRPHLCNYSDVYKLVKGLNYNSSKHGS